MTPTVRTVTTAFQIEPGYPTQHVTVKYRVTADETEITFPTGDKASFKNWDVRCVRQKFYYEEMAEQHNAEEGASVRSKHKELVEFGIRPQDVQKFVAVLVTTSRYEKFFDLQFNETVVEVEAPAALPVVEKPVKEVMATAPSPVAKAPALVNGVRRFPYIEVARLWNEGMTTREIAKTVGYLDDKKDCTHTMRTFLTKMHDPGYIDATGHRVKLPYRAKKAVAGA